VEENHNRSSPQYNNNLRSPNRDKGTRKEGYKDDPKAEPTLQKRKKKRKRKHEV